MCIEYNLGMVAGSLACLKPLFVQLGLVGPATGGPKDGLTPSYDKHSGGTVGTIGSGGTPRWALLRRGASRVQGDSILGTEMGTRVGHQKDADAGSKEHIVRRESSRRVTAGTEDAKEDE